MAQKEQTKVRVNVLFDPEEHERLLDYCEREGHKKSTLIARIVREYLASKSTTAPAKTRDATRRAKASTKSKSTSPSRRKRP